VKDLVHIDGVGLVIRGYASAAARARRPFGHIARPLVLQTDVSTIADYSGGHAELNRETGFPGIEATFEGDGVEISCA
jgi:hypothetical protein